MRVRAAEGELADGRLADGGLADPAAARSVRAALIKLNVDPARMESVGFGETKPISSNSTASGRAENRRTEFNIVEQ